MSGAVDAFVQNAQGVVSATSHHEGAYFHVYHGELADRDGTVRLLTLAPDIEDTTAAEAFMQTVGEWQNASTHPNIVTVYERSETPRPWVAVEDVDGQPLDDTQQNLEPTERASLVADTAEAIRNAALYNIVHGALSPEHIFVVPEDDGVAAVVDDWGLRQAVRTAVDDLEVTPFTAPELLEDSAASNERTDVYGLGGVAYYTLTGRPPASGADLTAAIRECEVPPPSTSDETLSEAVDEAVLQALAVTPEDRHESAYAFKRAFAAAYSPEPTEDDDGAAAAGAAAVGATDEDEAATDDSDDGSSALTTRRTVLGALGVGVVGLGGGLLATQMGDEDVESATDDSIDTPNELSQPEATQTNSNSESEVPETRPSDSINAQGGLSANEDSVYAFSDGEIVEYDINTGEELSSIDSPDDGNSGLAYGGGSLWYTDGPTTDYSGEILEVDPESGEVLSRIPTSYDPTGLAFGDGSLWVIDITTNQIVEYSVSGNEINAFDIRDDTGETCGAGLAYYENSLWVGTCDESPLYQFSRNGDFKGSSGKIQEYTGLAATDTQLFGPTPEGNLTVLRTSNSA
ncbi:protein kinase domain-containing protein [Haloarcula laminariae]|uniref:protein kinase domain-containing protein n=1 Tax=Haloarcula laminariae TaxID=2961577 RepID=UPI002406144B|nr:protein kinase [Halomicroarcula sp. FL173]